MTTTTTRCHCGMTRDALVHNTGPGWVNTHPFNGERAPQPVAQPLVSYIRRGTVYVERGGDHVRVDCDEIQHLIRNLAKHLDVLRDAR